MAKIFPQHAPQYLEKQLKKKKSKTESPLPNSLYSSADYFFNNISELNNSCHALRCSHEKQCTKVPCPAEFEARVD